MNKSICLVLFIALLSSCASILSGTSKRVTFTDEQINVPVDLTVDGIKYSRVILPAQVNVKRGFSDSKVVAEAEGYSPSTINIHKKFNSTALLSIPFGGIVGMGIDAATGAMTKPEYASYALGMKLAAPQKLRRRSHHNGW